MRFLHHERATLHQALPGLDDALADIALHTLEGPESPAIGLFREARGPALIIPSDLGGVGASALDALRVQRAIGSRSPSLAVATAMHHFSVASLVAVSESTDGMVWMLLQAIAKDNLIVASGFAEGRPGGQILAPTMTATTSPQGVRVSGVKKPCSLSRSMDLLTASLRLPRLDGRGEQLAVALIPVRQPGVSVSPFWSTFALAGAESDQVTLADVLVPEELIVRTDVEDGEQLDDLQNIGFLWFELMMMGTYIGAASALVERALASERTGSGDLLRLVVTVEGAMAAAETIARRLDDGESSRELLVDSLLVRYAVQDAIASLVPRAVELLGGLSFMGSPDVGMLATATYGLFFHPPARTKMAGPLMDYLAGNPLVIV